MALDTLTGAPVPEQTDDPAGLSSLPSQLAVIRDREIANRNKSWDAIAQTLEKSRPSKSEMWFSLASALAQPTKTGSFGEVIGNVSDTLGQSRKSQREFDTGMAKNQLARQQDLDELRSKYDLEEAKANEVITTVGDGGYWTQKRGYAPEWHAVAGAPTKNETWSDATQNGRAGQISSRGRFEPNALTVEEEASRAGQIDQARTSAIARSDLPKARLFAQNAKDLVAKLKAHPGRTAVIGLPDPRKGGWGFAQVPSSDAADFEALLEQATGQTFLQAYESLRGTGPIATVEGSKGEKAIARMQKAQSEKAFNEALDDYVDFLDKALAAKEELAGMGATPAKPSSGRRSAPTTPPPKANRRPIDTFYKQD